MTADVETLVVDTRTLTTEGDVGGDQILDVDTGTEELTTQPSGDVELLEVHVASPGDFPDLIDLGGPNNGSGA